jgi:hypothetical protein
MSVGLAGAFVRLDGEAHEKRRSSADLAGKGERTGMLFGDDGACDGEAEPGPLADVFGGENGSKMRSRISTGIPLNAGSVRPSRETSQVADVCKTLRKREAFGGRLLRRPFRACRADAYLCPYDG